MPQQRPAAPAGAAGPLSRIHRLLPPARPLPEDIWRVRHRFVLRTLIALTLGVAGYAVAQRVGPAAFADHVLPLAALTSLAATPKLPRGVRAVLASMGLMASAAVVVDLSGGSPEAHFLFFALLPLAVLYTTPVPFLSAVGFAAVHHLVLGALVPDAVFSPGYPVLPLAALHVALLLLESWACFVPWRRFEIHHTLVERLVDERTGQLRAQRDEMSRLALRDPLTGLGNRALLADRLERLLWAAPRAVSAAVLLLDLNDFKGVNDVYGHGAGDALLTEVGRRLTAGVRPADTVARLGGDEFVVLLAAADRSEAVGIADRLLTAVAEPIPWGSERFEIGGSIGLTLIDPEDPRTPADVLRDADIAMYAAKGTSTHTRVFEPAMREEVVAAGQLIRDLRTALPAGQLRLLYQPQVDLRTGRVSGVEALVRWQHPHKGLLGPDAFIPAAESTGMIDLVDDWVLTEACRQVAAWDAAGLPPMQVSVNVSARRLARGGITETLAVAAATAGADPARLEVEITETGAVVSPQHASAELEQLRGLGVSVAIDDFGTGHSSFARLRALPVDRVKIDKSFVSTLEPNAARGSIAGAMIALGDSLGLGVVAEGVETEDQLQALRALGCRTVQGYLFAPALPADELAHLVRTDAAA